MASVTASQQVFRFEGLRQFCTSFQTLKLETLLATATLATRGTR